MIQIIMCREKNLTNILNAIEMDFVESFVRLRGLLPIGTNFIGDNSLIPRESKIKYRLSRLD